MVNHMHGAASLSGQLAQHCDHLLHTHIRVLVDFVRRDEWINYHKADVVCLYLISHVAQEGVIGLDAVSGFRSQRDANCVFRIHEQFASYLRVRDVMLLHGGGQSDLHLGHVIF